MKTIARSVSAAALALSLAAALPASADTPAPLPATAERATALDARIGALFTPQGGLSADEVARRAGATSFDVLARRAELEAAAAAVDQAIVGFFPRVTLTGRYTRLSPLEDQVLGKLVAVDPKLPVGPIAPGTPLFNVPLSLPSLSNQSVLQASLNIPLSDYLLRLSQGYASASHSARAAELNERAARLKVGLDGRVAYYTWARARLQVFVAKQALEAARGHLADVRHSYTAGQSSKADVLRVEAQVASAELLVQRASGMARTTEESVRTALHDPDPARPLELGEDLRAALPPLGGPRGTSALHAEGLEKRLEIRALDETAWSLKEQAKVARAGYFPRVDAFGQVAYENPDQRIFPPQDAFHGSWAAGGQITWTLNDVATARFQGKQLDARAAQILAQKGALVDALRNEVTQAEQALEDAEVAIETGARGLAAAEESYRARRELFQNGRATSVELTDAETELTRAELDVVNARVDLRIARARVLHATGRDVGAATP